MEIERFVAGEYRCNNYLVFDKNIAILIDASVGIDELKSALTNKNATLKAVFITHSHFDHVLNLNEIIKEFKAKVYISKNGLENMQNSEKNVSNITQNPFTIKFDKHFNVVNDNNIVNIDNIEVNVYETMGHCNSGLCFKIDENLFTGDTLFYNSCGRVDLITSDLTQMISSLKKIEKIDGIKTYYPGHGFSFNNKTAINVIKNCVNDLL